MIEHTTKTGFSYFPKDSAPDIAVYARYGMYKGEPVQETAVFVLAGTNGSSADDPRKVTLPHDDHKQKWLLAYGENVLGKPELLQKGYHPLALPLSEHAQLVNEKEYIAAKGRVLNSNEIALQSMRRVQALHTENKDKKVKILKSLGLSEQEIEIMLS